MQLLKYRKKLITIIIILGIASGRVMARGLGEFQKEMKEKLSPSAYSRLGKVMNILAQAEKEGLPSKPLINKLKEGLIKNQPIGNIEKAVSERKYRLKVCQDLLKKEEIQDKDKNRFREIIVEAMERNVPQNVLEEVITKISRKGRRTDYIEETVESLGDLINDGVSHKEAVAGIKPILEGNLSKKEIKTLVGNIINKKKEEVRKAEEERKRIRKRKKIETKIRIAEEAKERRRKEREIKRQKKENNRIKREKKKIAKEAEKRKRMEEKEVRKREEEVNRIKREREKIIKDKQKIRKDPGVSPRGKPGVSPGGKPGVSPRGKPGVSPGGKPGVSPGGKPGVSPGGKPGGSGKGKKKK